MLQLHEKTQHFAFREKVNTPLKALLIGVPIIQGHIILSKVDEAYLCKVETETANRVNDVGKIVLEVEMEEGVIWT